jgi:hypothetical protein
MSAEAENSGLDWSVHSNREICLKESVSGLDMLLHEGVEGVRLEEDGDNIDIEQSVSLRRPRLLQCEPHSGGGCNDFKRKRSRNTSRASPWMRAAAR